MRNPERIDEFCKELAEIWKTNCPDWRFSQFIINVFGSFATDPWFWEEDQMIEEIRKFFDAESAVEED